MTTRTLRGVGVASYLPIEDELARALIDAGHHDEVVVLHTMKVELDARPVAEHESWFREQRAVEPRQEVLL